MQTDILARDPMAKKKSQRHIGRPRSPEGPKKQILTLRGSEEYKDWLDRFARHMRKDKSDLIDESLERMAVAEKFDRPPKR